MSTIEDAIDAAVSRAIERHMLALREDLAALRASQPPRMLTIAQAAEALGCCTGTVRRMCKAGSLVYKYVGAGRNAIRIDASSLHGAGGGDVGARRAARGGRG